MIDMSTLFREQVEHDASDLHLKIGRPPIFRLVGEMTVSDHPEVTAEDMDTALKQLLGEDGYRKLQDEGEADFSYLFPGVARFRINAFRHLGQLSLAARAIPIQPPTFDSYPLPPVLRDLVTAPQGLILVTGPTGSGKSTTLACMIEHLNQTQPLNIITLEDPVEFVYTDQRSTIRQRQVGTDVQNFHEALRRVLRQDPDVILIGELRDRETVEMALHAAETGHLVLSTLHTNDAKQTIDRIIDIFPAETRDHIRSMLSLTLHAVLSQRLVSRKDRSGRVVAMEVLVNNPHVRDLIAQNKIREIDAALKAGQHYRMQTFNQSLAKLVQDGLVKEEDAMSTSSNPNELQQLLRGIGASTPAAPAAAVPGRSPTSRIQVPVQAPAPAVDPEWESMLAKVRQQPAAPRPSTPGDDTKFRTK